GASAPASASTSRPSSAAAPPASAPAAATALPAARKMMAEQNIAAADVTGTGRGGRITKADVQSAPESKGSSARPVAQPAAEAPRPEPLPSVQLPANLGARAEQRVPMSRLRQRVAERLVQSQ